MHSGDIWSELGKLMKQLINWNLSHQSLEPSAASFTFQTISWWPNRTLSINTQESMRYCHVATSFYGIDKHNDTFNPYLIKLHIFGDFFTNSIYLMNFLSGRRSSRVKQWKPFPFVSWNTWRQTDYVYVCMYVCIHTVTQITKGSQCLLWAVTVRHDAAP